MKMVMIVYNEVMDVEVMEALAKCSVANYTKVAGAFGRGTSSGTHLGTDIWPGLNNILYVACDEKDARQLFSCVGTLRAQLGKEGIKAFMWALDGITD